MTDSKLRPTSLDYALAAIAPALIILMIGSLVAFLMTTLYQGEFPMRLMWVLGLYTFASVLISRIAIEQSRSQAMVYLVLLAGATLFVAPRYFVIEGPLAPWSLLILAAFLGLITYLADRITYDCTDVDASGESHGEGLLQSLGLLKKSRSAATKDFKKRKHNPGVWVLYFGLLAVPVFGIGQWFITSSSGRSLAWMYMVVYLLSALLLLVMISLLSVRRYARQRDLEMDVGLSMKWLAAGAASVAALMLGMSILSLPASSGGFWEAPFKITNRDNLQSHRWGWGKEGVQEGNSNNESSRKLDSNQQSGNQQSGNQQSGNQQSGNQQSGNQQSGNQQSGNQQSAAGQSAIGQSAVGQSAAGQSAVGQSAVGQSAVGQSAAGQPAAGQPAAGDTCHAATAGPATTFIVEWLAY